MATMFYRVRDLTGTAATRKRGDKGLLGTSPTWLWRKVKSGEFPAPVKLSQGVTAFEAHKVDAWIAARSGDRSAA